MSSCPANAARGRARIDLPGPRGPVAARSQQRVLVRAEARAAAPGSPSSGSRTRSPSRRCCQTRAVPSLLCATSGRESRLEVDFVHTAVVGAASVCTPPAGLAPRGWRHRPHPRLRSNARRAERRAAARAQDAALRGVTAPHGGSRFAPRGPATTKRFRPGPAAAKRVPPGPAHSDDRSPPGSRRTVRVLPRTVSARGPRTRSARLAAEPRRRGRACPPRRAERHLLR